MINPITENNMTFNPNFLLLSKKIITNPTTNAITLIIARIIPIVTKASFILFYHLKSTAHAPKPIINPITEYCKICIPSFLDCSFLDKTKINPTNKPIKLTKDKSPTNIEIILIVLSINAFRLC